MEVRKEVFVRVYLIAIKRICDSIGGIIEIRSVICRGVGA
jgi:hypothetical protein